MHDDPTTTAWLERDEVALAGVLPRYYDIVAARGEGSWLIDVDGRRYLDLGSGIAVNSTGHCHPPRGRRDHRPGVDPAAHLGRRAPPAQRRARGAHPRARPVPRRPPGVLLQLRGRGHRRCHQAGAPRHGPAWRDRVPARVPRPHARGHDAHHREGEVPGGLRAAPSWRAHRSLVSAPRAPDAGSCGRGCARRPRRGPRHRGALDDRSDDRRAGARGGRLRRAARRVAARPPRALRPPRDPACVRRGPVRHLANRCTVRGGDVRGRPRRRAVREGHRVRSPARRDRRAPTSSWRDGRPARTAARSAATRSRAAAALATLDVLADVGPSVRALGDHARGTACARIASGQPGRSARCVVSG